MIDFDDTFFDWEDIADHYHSRVPHAPSGALCKRCGRYFDWGVIGYDEDGDPIWRLITPGGREHTCGRVASVNEFDVVE